MDCKYLVLLICVAGAAAQTISDFPTAPVGMTVGERHVIHCGISGAQGFVFWQLGGNFIYDGQAITDTTNYDINITRVNNLDYYSLIFKSASRALAGEYTCSNPPGATGETVTVYVFDQPTLAPVNSGQLVAGMEEILMCEVEYGATLDDNQNFNLHILDGDGIQITDVNANEWEIDQAPTPDVYKRRINTTSLTLDWEDNLMEYACVVTMTDYSMNVTEEFDVWHTAANISLSPYDPQNYYYKTEVITVNYNANPNAKQWIWYRWVNEDWEVIGDDDDQDETLTIGNWPSDTTIKVDIINSFDHDGTGGASDQNSTQIFPMTIFDCCRAGDASHVTYSALMTSLFVVISAVFLER